MSEERERGYVYYDERDRCWYARLTYRDEGGRRRNIKRAAKTESKAQTKLKNLLKEIDDQGAKSVEAAKLTFNDLANYYEEHYCKPAVYVEERKVAGLRDVGRAMTCLKRFREYFGSRLLAGIRYTDIRSYYLARLKQHTYHDRPPTVATMNRELGVLRRIFRIAVREEWIRRSPFDAGESLISPSSERMRERILSLEEERLLLAALVRDDVRVLVICLIDTGARLSEFLKHLTWLSVNFDSRTITIHATTTKTLTARRVMMTERMCKELSALWEASPKDAGGRVFNRLARMVQRDFKLACAAVGIPYGSPYGITLHSLRHTAATRLVKGQMPIQMVGRLLGHTQPKTTYRYLTADTETQAQAAAIMEALQSQSITTQDATTVSESVN